jgi:hypothetical protein
MAARARSIWTSDPFPPAPLVGFGVAVVTMENVTVKSVAPPFAAAVAFVCVIQSVLFAAFAIAPWSPAFWPLAWASYVAIRLPCVIVRTVTGTRSAFVRSVARLAFTLSVIAVVLKAHAQLPESVRPPTNTMGDLQSVVYGMLAVQVDWLAFAYRLHA